MGTEPGPFCSPVSGHRLVLFRPSGGRFWFRPHKRTLLQRLFGSGPTLAGAEPVPRLPPTGRQRPPRFRKRASPTTPGASWPLWLAFGRAAPRSRIRRRPLGQRRNSSLDCSVLQVRSNGWGPDAAIGEDLAELMTVLPAKTSAMALGLAPRRISTTRLETPSTQLRPGSWLHDRRAPVIWAPACSSASVAQAPTQNARDARGRRCPGTAA